MLFRPQRGSLEEAANMMEEIEMVRAKMNATNFNNLLKPEKKD